MPTDAKSPPRRFLLLRILFFLLSLPLLAWALYAYGSRLWAYLAALPTLEGIWFWLWTIPIVWASWAMARAVRRKRAKARTLAAEIKRR